MAENIHIIAVLGLSYSGSTLLNFILDSHSKIVGAGEIHSLLRRKTGDYKYAFQCTSCQKKCPYWTKDIIENISEHQFYHQISKIFKKKIIVDTSKSYEWFTQRRDTSAKQLKFFFVLMVKHPIRLITSFLINTENREAEGMDIYQDIDYLIGYFYQYYGNLQKLMDQESKKFASPYITLKYEDCVNNLPHALNPLLTELQLRYEPIMENCYSIPHHSIGGNNGTLFQIRENWGMNENIVSRHKKEFYKGKKGIFMDEKYKKRLTSDQIRDIMMDERIRDLLQLFSYPYNKI